MKKIVTPEINLYPYQATDIQNIEQAWTENRSVLYQLSTGGGKSVVLSKLVSDYPNEQILIFAHKRRLLTQLHSRLNALGIQTGILFANRAENLDAKVLVVSIRTAVKDARLEKLLERKWDRVIIDEARHSRTGSYDKVLDALLEKYPTHKLLGVDATPYRKDGKRLDKHFQYLVVSSENTASLIEKGYLAKYRTYQSPINKEELKEKVKEAGGDYQSTELSHFMRQPMYLEYIVRTYKERGEERQAIVFAVDKAHAKDLKAEFEKSGYTKIAQIDSDMDQSEVDQAFADYESKKIQLLINIEMITEGVDLPDTGCIVGARPTKSLTLYLQIVGRGTRKKSDGSDLIILDCCGWTQEYGVLSSPKHWSLNPDINPNNPREKNKVVGKRKNGEFTEDLTDFIGELIEMTPEEYVQHLSGGLEGAKSANLSIDEKIQKLLEALAQLIIVLMKSGYTDCNYIVKKDRYDENYTITFFHKSIPIDKWDTYRNSYVQLFFKKGVVLFPDLNINRGREPQDNERALHMTIIAGKMAQLFIDHDVATNLERKSQGLIEQIIDLEKNKINLDLFKKQAEQFKEEQWMKAIADALKENEVLALPVSVDEDRYFQGYSNWKIVGIKIPNQRIIANQNKITLLKEKRERNWRYQENGKPEYEIHKSEEFKQYVKGEKIYEILKASKWGEEVKELVTSK